MADALHRYLSSDHQRLESLLEASVREDGSIDPTPYDEFRRGLLRHIGIEERILLPEIRRRRGSTVVEEQIHLDHAALGSLLVPPPTLREIETIRSILQSHNPLEEGEGGLYEIFEQLADRDLEELMERVRSFPQIPLSPEADTPVVRRSIEENLRKAAESRRRLSS